jgi:uncharacterized protein (DUF433 family)
MKEKADSVAKRVELGQFLVADVAVCGGQPTYKGTRIMAWIVLEQLERGLSWDRIAKEWDGKVTHDAIAETVALFGRAMVWRNHPQADPVGQLQERPRPDRSH